MSGYENVVGGKLKLKGKALDVKSAGMKKKKKQKKPRDQVSQMTEQELEAGQSTEESVIPQDEEDVANDSALNDEGQPPSYEDHMTPAEKRYIEQRERIDLHRMAKEANKSHRDRIENFNQYLANMSEHYDIPKVGPG